MYVMHIRMYAKLNWKHKVQLITLKIRALLVSFLDSSSPYHFPETHSKTKFTFTFLKLRKYVFHAGLSPLCSFVFILFSHLQRTAKKNYSIQQLIITLKKLAQ